MDKHFIISYSHQNSLVTPFSMLCDITSCQKGNQNIAAITKKRKTGKNTGIRNKYLTCLFLKI